MTQMRMRTRLAAGTLTAFLVLFGVACGDDDDDDATAEGTTETTIADGDEPAGDADQDDSPADTGSEASITIKTFQFTVSGPADAGSTVTVSNDDSAPHTVTADDGEFDSGEISANGEGEFTAPDEPGTYSFHCEIHESMKGELEVS